jgi:hypothetical protein
LQRKKAVARRQIVPIPCDANGRCRLHGGASPGASRGDGQRMFKHGLRSIEVLEHRRKMRRIRREMHEFWRD